MDMIVLGVRRELLPTFQQVAVFLLNSCCERKQATILRRIEAALRLSHKIDRENSGAYATSKASVRLQILANVLCMSGLNLSARAVHVLLLEKGSDIVKSESKERMQLHVTGIMSNGIQFLS